MIPRAVAAIERHGLLRGARAIVAGVSGGADSTAMALLLAPLCRKRGIRLVVGHLHHGIRGRPADLDQAFVRRLTAELGVEFRSAQVDVPALARRRRISLEMAARAARHEFLAGVARDCGADRVALAHTADDQAETVLLRLARGAGRGGLGGMACATRVGGLHIVRPLLDVPRAEIVAVLRRRGHAWREDASNRDLRHLRNRVRRHVLPMLERELNPRIRETLVRTAEVLRVEDDWLDRRARSALRACSDSSGVLSAASLRRRPAALRGRIVLAWLRAAGVPESSLNGDTVARVLRLAEHDEGSRRIAAGGAWSVERVYGELRAVVRKHPIGLSEELRLTAKRARGFVSRPEAGVGMWPAEASIDAARADGSPLVLRPWRPGDRMRPLGAPGAAKIHDILVNLKVPRARRAGVRVVECRGEIVWLPGHRIAEGWRVRGPRSASLRLRVEPAAEGGGLTVPGAAATVRNRRPATHEDDTD